MMLSYVIMDRIILFEGNGNFGMYIRLRKLIRSTWGRGGVETKFPNMMSTIFYFHVGIFSLFPEASR